MYFLSKGLTVQIVNRDVEEALILRVMEIHGDNVIGASARHEVCY